MKFELKNLSLNFKNKKLFENLNLTFQGPGLFAILGPSGCGKSTLIRLLSGLQQPSSGQIIQPSQFKPGFIFQESHLLSWRTTYENVSLPLELGHSSSKYPDLKNQIHPLVVSSLQTVGLDTSQSLYPSELSGGMKMRVSLARAFVTDPDVLFCDEPFAALDEVTREDLQAKLRKKILEKQGVCFFVTHNLSEALAVADFIYYFKGPGLIENDPILVNRSQNFDAQLESLRKLVRGSFR